MNDLTFSERAYQSAYDLGYDNPTVIRGRGSWQTGILAFAYMCGQADYQNTTPRNPTFKWDEYDPQTFERNPPQVELGT